MDGSRKSSRGLQHTSASAVAYVRHRLTVMFEVKTRVKFEFIWNMAVHDFIYYKPNLVLNLTSLGASENGWFYNVL